MTPRQPRARLDREARPSAAGANSDPATAAGKDERTNAMTATLDALTVGDSAARDLVCRGCGARFPLAAQHACHECFGPLEVGYDESALRKVTRAQIEAGPPNLWRYAGLLPIGARPADRVTLNPGWTPLVRPDAVGAAL